MTLPDLLTSMQLRRSDLQLGREAHEKELANLKIRSMYIDEAAQIVADAASSARSQIQGILEGLVTTALNEVFPEEAFTFTVSFEIKYGKTSVKFGLQRGDEVLDPIDGCGGGVCDVISFMLRVACIYLSGSRRLLIADEPFKFLSAGKRPKIYQCVYNLCKEYGLDVLMVSHDPMALDYADRHYIVQKQENISTVAG